jgi:hypothetical protein
MMNVWVRGAPRRSSLVIIHESENFDKGLIREFVRQLQAPQAGVEPTTSALGEPRSIH